MLIGYGQQLSARALRLCVSLRLCVKITLLEAAKTREGQRISIKSTFKDC